MEANRNRSKVPAKKAAKVKKQKNSVVLTAQALMKKPLAEFQAFIENPESQDELEESVIPADA